ncbi:MAG: hypothetical protein AAGU23_01145 [Bacillota bacterium]
MKKLIFLILLLSVLSYLLLLSPRIIDAINLRLIASPENILNRFYTEQGLAVDQVVDSLILGGPKVLPLLECKILNRETPRRVYAIYALSDLGNNDSIPSLEYILQDKNEEENFRVAALLAIASINLPYAQKIAPQYLNDTTNIAKYAYKVLNPDSELRILLDKRSYWDAFFHRHD